MKCKVINKRKEMLIMSKIKETDNFNSKRKFITWSIWSNGSKLNTYKSTRSLKQLSETISPMLQNTHSVFSYIFFILFLFSLRISFLYSEVSGYWNIWNHAIIKLFHEYQLNKQTYLALKTILTRMSEGINRN